MFSGYFCDRHEIQKTSILPNNGCINRFRNYLFFSCCLHFFYLFVKIYVLFKIGLLFDNNDVYKGIMK